MQGEAHPIFGMLVGGAIMVYGLAYLVGGAKGVKVVTKNIRKVVGKAIIALGTFIRG